MNKKRIYAVGIGKCLIFGFSFLFTKRLLDRMAFMDLLAYRFLLAAVAFEILRIAKVIKIDLKNKNLKTILLIVMIQPVGYYVFETLGLQRASTLMSGILMSFMPLIILILEVVFLKEKTTGTQKTFLFLSVAGVLLISVLSSGGKDQMTSVLGIMLIAAALVCEGFFSILTRRFSTVFTPMEITYSMMWASALSFNAANIVRRIALGTISEYFVPMLDPYNLINLLYLGILCSCAGYLMYNYMLSKIQASAVSVFAGLTTMTTVAAGVMLNSEPFFWFHAVGGVFIFLGVWGTNKYAA